MSFGTGKIGEELAIKYLEDKGFRVLAKNVRQGNGEIDIIVLKDGIIGFVEVRTTATDYLRTPLSSINYKKILSIKKTALKIISKLKISSEKIAFHYIGIKLKNDNDFEVEFFENVDRGIC